jgi:hypothetical protein
MVTLALRNKTLKKHFLKVLTNEKRGGITVVSFDRSPLHILAEIFKQIGAGPLL